MVRCVPERTKIGMGSSETRSLDNGKNVDGVVIAIRLASQGGHKAAGEVSREENGSLV